MSVFNKLKNYIKNRYSTWTYSKLKASKDPEALLIEYTNRIIDRYSWELVHNDLKSMLEINNQLWRINDSFQEEANRFQRLYLNEKYRYQTLIERQENEIKHLKDLIEAKNLIIDKLTKEQK